MPRHLHAITKHCLEKNCYLVCSERLRTQAKVTKRTLHRGHAVCQSDGQAHISQVVRDRAGMPCMGQGHACL